MALSPQERSRRMRLNMLMAMSYAVAGRTTFTPLSLFSAGEQGAWYDPSDFSTMFQDSAGTTPVTAVEQPVGLILDKSKGLAIGAENVVNGAITTNLTSWTAVNDAGSTAVASASGAVLTSASGVSFARLRQTVPAVSGTWYKISFTLVSGSLNFDVWGTGYGSGSLIQQLNYTTTGVRTYIVAATSANLYVQISSSASSTATVTGISVTSLAGNHASQSTSTSRPVLSARVNLLTYSEQFDNAAWSKLNVLAFGSGSVANGTTAPDGTTTADKITPDTSNTNHRVEQSITWTAASYTVSIWAKAAGYNFLKVRAFFGTGISQLYDLGNGTLGTAGTGTRTATITDAGNGWYKCTLTFTASAAAGNIGFEAQSTDIETAFVANGSDGVYIWGADIRFANQTTTLPTYQRVGAATAGTSSAAGTGDYDTTGFPYYLKHDGADDFLVTGNINFSATDQITVHAGIRKIAEVAGTQQIVAELSATRAANNGAWTLLAPGSSSPNGDVLFVSKGTSDGSAASTANAYPAPVTVVLTGTGHISGDSAVIRANGVQAGASASDQGTGNFGSAYPLYIGRRGGTSNAFNGHIYGLVVVGRALTTTEITNMETWLNNKTKAF